MPGYKEIPGSADAKSSMESEMVRLNEQSNEDEARANDIVSEYGDVLRGVDALLRELKGWAVVENLSEDEKEKMKQRGGDVLLCAVTLYDEDSGSELNKRRMFTDLDSAAAAKLKKFFELVQEGSGLAHEVVHLMNTENPKHPLSKVLSEIISNRAYVPDMFDRLPQSINMGDGFNTQDLQSDANNTITKLTVEPIATVLESE